MNLALIEIFSAVMKTGSTTRAAALLGISQPGVSRGLRRLEDTTKLKLFERSGPRLNATPEALLLYREVQAAHAGLDRLRQAAARIREVGTGSLKVASSAALGLSFMPRVIAKYLKRRPDVPITFEIASSLAVRDLVTSGLFDFGLCANEIDITNLVAEPFIESYGVCVFRQDHALAGKRFVGPHDLQQERLICLAPEDTARKQLDRHLVAADVSPRMIVETQFSATVCQLAIEGAGVGVANVLSYVSEGYEKAGLVARPLIPTVKFITLQILPPQRARSRLVDEFSADLVQERDKLVEECRKYDPNRHL
ncbi:Transcriptional regulator, LysR family [Mesorhizobium metallidurans STM 2683]|uniref:Transcriptional regulator, LysR family n=1 Tax=Mesorhizobium metallidurans STM 2683 TaxID=1297569 RepID=M5F944_9HYPH|nr:LysR substrate-binding domain-containing protein [Mesorhizobium metallidurans]CCV08416.1 Transcriptional regulator, LysR family [Mesorhizobium metallidurans STM 2683]